MDRVIKNVMETRNVKEQNESVKALRTIQPTQASKLSKLLSATVNDSSFGTKSSALSASHFINFMKQQRAKDS